MSRSMKMLAGLSLALGLAASGGAVHAGAILSDGTFTSPSGGSSFVTYGTNGISGPMGPWTVSGSVDLIGNYWDGPSPGQGSVDMDGNQALGSISQHLILPGAGTYTLFFDLSGNPDGGPTTKTLDVQIGSLPVSTFTYTLTGANTHTNMLYDPEHLTFTWNGMGGDPLLTFSSADDTGNSFGPVVANVSVAVPEAATWAMMLLGAGMVGAGLRMARGKGGATAAI